MSLRNAAVGVGASRQSSKVSSKVLPVPLTDVCLSRSVRSGNDGRPGVVPWGASMSLHSVFSCANIISVFALRASESGTYTFLIRERFLDSRFPPPHCGKRALELIAFIDKPKNLLRHVRAVLLQG